MEITQINGATFGVKISVTKNDIEKNAKNILTRLAKTTKIAGFRVGKVPENVIKNRYGESIKNDAKNDALREKIKHATDEISATRRVIGQAFVDKIDEKDGDFFANVKISVIPEFSVDNLLDFTPDFRIPEADDTAIDARIKNLAMATAELSNAPENHEISTDDVVIFDFSGEIDGKKFDGSSAQNVSLQIGSGTFIPGFEDALKGLKIGDEKDISLQFPENYHVKNLAGKNAIFAVKIHEIKQKNLPENLHTDEIARQILKKDANFAKLREEVKKEIENEAKNALYVERVKFEFVDALLKNIIFDLPENIIEQEMDILLQNTLNSLSPAEVSDLTALKKSDENAFAAELKNRRENLRENATKSVHLTLLIDAAAKKYEITVSDSEILNAIYFEALQNGLDPKTLAQNYEKNGLLPAVKMAILEDKVLKFLLDKKASGGAV